MLKGILAGLIATVTLSGAIQAQQYPNKPVTFLIGSPAGGLTDLAGRFYGDVVSKALGQRVVIENRPGGWVSAQAMVNAAPDGYTILLTPGGQHEILSHLQPPPFHPLDDFRFVTMLFYTTTFVWTRTDLGVNNLKELAEVARRTKGGLTWGSTGVGSPGHLLGELFKLQSGAPIEIVQYASAGGAGMQTDLMTSRLDVSTGGFNVFQAGLAEKKLKMLAANSDARSTRFPDVPTLGEAGYPGAVVFVWWGLAVPAKTPDAIVKRLHDEFEAAARDPELRAKMDAQDITPRTSSPEEATALVTANRERFGKVIRDAGIKLN